MLSFILDRLCHLAMSAASTIAIFCLASTSLKMKAKGLDWKLLSRKGLEWELSVKRKDLEWEEKVWNENCYQDYWMGKVLKWKNWTREELRLSIRVGNGIFWIIHSTGSVDISEVVGHLYTLDFTCFMYFSWISVPSTWRTWPKKYWKRICKEYYVDAIPNPTIFPLFSF